MCRKLTAVVYLFMDYQALTTFSQDNFIVSDLTTKSTEILSKFSIKDPIIPEEIND